MCCLEATKTHDTLIGLSRPVYDTEENITMSQPMLKGAGINTRYIRVAVNVSSFDDKTIQQFH